MPADDQIKMLCPNLRCRRMLRVPPQQRGKFVKCRVCGTLIRIPKASQPAGAARDN